MAIGELVRRFGALPIVLCYSAILAAMAAGVFLPLDNVLRDGRFSAQSRSASGNVVFVDIDSRSLESVGVWPWPRHVHAEILDKLMALGASDVVFDVDFSVASTPAEDDAFATSLENAGGYAFLAAFQQQRMGPELASYNLPYAPFRKFADPVAVNVILDTGGVVRTYPFALPIGGEAVNSAASVLSGVNGAPGTAFDIDYSIDPRSIDRISAADLLAGKVSADRIADKQVIIGASAVELRDYFVVPRYGVLPGGLLQALATETLRQDRALQPLVPVPGEIIVVAIGISALLFRRRIALPAAITAAVALSLLVEAAALLLQSRYGLLADTAGIHLATVVFAVSVLLTELAQRGVQKRVADDRLRYLSRHDPLTGALSRLRLTELIVDAAAREIGIIIVDLRRFRVINDTLGHGQGDILLKQVVSRLREMGPDAVARLGGDSFALLVPDMDAERLRGFCAAVTQWIAFPYQLADGHQALIAASAGATTSRISGHDPETLLAHADMALSAAKPIPGNAAALYEPEMGDRLKDRTVMHAALRRGIAEQQLSLAYQPQVDLVTGEILSVEGLARWTHPTLGAISPADFIPAAEETGLIVELGRWALNTACRDTAEWPGQVKVAVNLSPVQLELSDVAADVAAALKSSGLPADRLEVEITEGVFVNNFEAVAARLFALRHLGVSIALDDFGTGYSSLSYLGQLPVDKIKIDQSFVRRMPVDAEAQAIVKAVIALTQTLGKVVIAEGIETAEQARLLGAMGCTIGQGYYFGRPVRAKEIAARLREAELDAAVGA